MFAQERIRIIRNYLVDNRQVEVHALSTMLNVSEVTIRRDLEKLEREGVLTRTHGGAILRRHRNGAEGDEADISDEGEAHEISIVAANMIEDGDVIMLTGGSVSDCIAVRLRERNGLTVLTNYISVAVEIATQPANRVVLLGGDLASDGRSIFGALSLANLRRFHVNTLFAEVDGVSEDLEVTVAGHEKAELIEAAMESADQKILVCPASRFERNAFYRLGRLSMADRLITNPTIPDLLKMKIFNSNIPLHTSINLYEGRV